MLGIHVRFHYPVFRYSLDYDRRMTYVIFKGSKTRNRNPALDLPTRIFSKKKIPTPRVKSFRPPVGLSRSPETHLLADSQTSGLLVTTRQPLGLRRDYGIARA